MSDLCSSFVFSPLCSLDNLANACYVHSDGHALTNSPVFSVWWPCYVLGWLHFKGSLKFSLKSLFPLSYENMWKHSYVMESCSDPFLQGDDVVWEALKQCWWPAAASSQAKTSLFHVCRIIATWWIAEWITIAESCRQRPSYCVVFFLTVPNYGLNPTQEL